jgi:hypothetical protein
MERDMRFEFVHVLEAVSDIYLTLVDPSKHSRGQSYGFREAMLIFPYVGETIVELLLWRSLDRTGSRNHHIDQIGLRLFDPFPTSHSMGISTPPCCVSDAFENIHRRVVDPSENVTPTNRFQNPMGHELDPRNVPQKVL